jgi:hypothetical protein
MLTNDKLNRRTCLKGVSLGAGAVVLQPFLNSLAAEEAGEAPPRVVVVLQSNGLSPHHVRPEGLGSRSGSVDKMTNVSLEEHELPDAISPLTPFKDRMSIVMGLSAKQARPNHGAGYGALGLYNARGAGGAGNRNTAHAQTIDHALADSLPGLVPVVGLGVPSDPDRIFSYSSSVISRKRPMPIICQPDIAFQSLFGSVAEGSAAKQFHARNKVLDWIRSDIKRVRQQLPAMDREKLDVYLDTFEQMRGRQDTIATIKDQLKAHQPASDKFKSRSKTDVFESQCALAASSLACGLTNVVLLDAHCGPNSYKVWSELGINERGNTIGHMSWGSGGSKEKYSIPIRQYHCQRVADLAKRLDAIPEGDGTVLDNTLIIFMSDFAHDHHSQGLDWPMILVGNLGGRLKTDGRFLQYPGYGKTGHRTMENFYLSLLSAVGDNRKSFGVKDTDLLDLDTAGPLAEIMA